MLGNVVYAKAFWYRNSPLTNPAWRYAIPDDAAPANTDYKRFLGPARNTSFNKQRYFQWRLYWDYSGGISTDLLVHQTDALHMITGRHYCESVVCNGGIHHWIQDDREVPDTVTAAYEYDDHFHISYSAAFSTSHYGYGEQLCGSEGTMEIMGMRYLNVYPEKARGLPEKVSSRPEMHFDARKDFNETNSTNEHQELHRRRRARREAELSCGIRPRSGDYRPLGHHGAAQGKEGFLEPARGDAPLRLTGRVTAGNRPGCAIPGAPGTRSLPAPGCRAAPHPPAAAPGTA